MRHTSLLALAVAGTLLAGCAATPPHQTYDAIKRDIASAASASAPGARAAAGEDAVANALLPPAAALARELPKARPALEERFNVAFNNVPAQQFFRSIVAGTRYNMLVHPEVAGNISANLKDVTLAETLEAVREMYGYDYKIDGTRITIRPLTMQTRMFHVNYLVGSRRGSSNLRVTSTSVSNVANNNGNGNQGQQGQQGQQGNQNQNGNNQNGFGGNATQVASTDVNMLSDSDFWGDLKSSIEAIVGSREGGRSVVVSPQSGVLVIRAMPEELRNVDMYLKATQLSVDRQVILEAKILEVELNEQFQSGVNWASFSSIGNSRSNRAATGIIAPGAGLAPLPFNGGQPPIIANGQGLAASTGFSLSNAANAAGSLFGFAFQTNSFAALISLLEQQGTVHVLSSPRVAAVNNQKAVLKIGTDEFFVTGVTTTTNTSTTGNTVTPSVTLQPFFSGVVLDVTPQIDEKGNILLHVHPSVSQVTTITKGIDLGSAGSLTLPLAASSTSELDSIVRGQDGQVVAVGGLMRQAATDDTSGLPGAGRVPVLGALFRNKNKVAQKRELVVLIKPTIVDSASNWSQDLLDTTRRIEGLDPRTLERK
ncbi:MULTISPECIES: pilus (MSHA type) biogenesis protein MshL [unclassified Massilia]|uniref:pilus (MSHA type) biogenesis protein MshL n=1 Tax=unclassified Massilia TaxID=2609279 RepID=UPI00177FFB9E|nr:MULTISPECIES: pilus (MSHA type) biogenesis protein MshL [unclassified Massilia]MBD8529495.1 pilus (MSHA type) biogenesis protein MshL [Massilia sp. CFBP 13647]MBD8672888.1 pilus (MSHA type) biogenesis protein MshL [Massilia sp. CFBP 13721]